MSASRRYEILPPLRFNDGQSVPDALISDTLLELENRFGAVSWETQIIRGRWRHEEEVDDEDKGAPQPQFTSTSTGKASIPLTAADRTRASMGGLRANAGAREMRILRLCQHRRRRKTGSFGSCTNGLLIK